MMNQTITLKPKLGSSSGLPLQIYETKAPASHMSTRQSTLYTPSQTSSESTLSRSSQYLLDHQSSLSTKEKENLARKIAVETRASQALEASRDLHILYIDAHLCVVVKPSGILSVPGPRRNPSLAQLVYDKVQPTNVTLDQMIVHRLDMDTSGIIVYALTEMALQVLHEDFRSRRVHKTYQALLLGHLSGGQGDHVARSTLEWDIDIALERDPHHPPFMRVTQFDKKAEASTIMTNSPYNNDDNNDSTSTQAENILPDKTLDPRVRKFMNQAPKPSHSSLCLQSFEHLTPPSTKKSIAVTRVNLVPHTGRTHQLRVHTAALGYPIIGDDIYGPNGEGDCGSVHKYKEETEDAKDEARMTDSIPLCLHAMELCFYHPLTGAPMMFICHPPF
jgi:tRNA pseudouridine32 synthase / 23S rRNA pseudouridine746 synthase